MINKKIRVANHEQSALIQGYLFNVGMWWGVGEPKKFLTVIPPYYLYTNDRGCMYWSNPKNSSFDSIKCEEMLFDFELVIANVRRRKEPELVEFNGKKYVKEDLEKALALLTPAT